MQNSLRSSEASFNASARSGSKNTCTMPSRSRISIKIRLPRSRRRLTQPHRVTCCPTWDRRSCPQYSVRMRYPLT
ncbi:hypothetical protein A225_3683 [Klebsiella michiganensis E718]|nr:hypothetical protein A225_3683 [Klebsiella michiganensis E718]